MKPLKVKEGESVLAAIWRVWADECSGGYAKAYINLQKNLARHVDALVPNYYTAKELRGDITELQSFVVTEKEEASSDPRAIVGDWLRGDTDLSRTRMENAMHEDDERVQ